MVERRWGKEVYREAETNDGTRLVALWGRSGKHGR